MLVFVVVLPLIQVALPVSAWIEIGIYRLTLMFLLVALPVSAWIEINVYNPYNVEGGGRTPRECVD